MPQWPTTLALAISTHERRGERNGPVADDVGVGQEHQWREAVRGEQADGLARLYHQGLVLLHPLERGHDAVDAVPVARGLGAAGVDDQLLGPLADLQGVLQQARDGFLAPALAAQRRVPLRGDVTRFPNGHVSFLHAWTGA